jgi:23S rRNA (uracil1939-C5)-methyltransferase
MKKTHDLAARPSTGEKLELDILDLAETGAGVGRDRGFVFFVRGALPGSRVLARVTAVKKNLAEAVAEQVLSPSPLAREPFCAHFGRCGGCLIQNLTDAAQLDWKTARVRQALSRIAGVSAEVVRPALASPQTTAYRNKMEFAFGGTAGEGLTLGLRHRDRPDQVVDLSECHLCPSPVLEVLDTVRGLARETGLAARTGRPASGYFRHLVVRAFSSGDLHANLITAPGASGRADMLELGQALMDALPRVKGFVHSTRADGSGPARGEEAQAGLGQWAAEERLAGLSFSVSPESFFQVNTGAAERLMATVAAMGRFTGKETVWDLYCGGGALGLALSRSVARVEGLELSAAAVEDARENATRNGIENCRFTAVDLSEVGEALSTLPRPDVAVCDPPRAGLDPAITAALLAARPPVILAVSCHPATLARDVGLLSPTYVLEEAAPVDLFPHTPHVECVARLVLAQP